MYEIYPFFTNDGSLGLYSPKDNDIYHSMYGALTESYQKFVLPAHLENFIDINHKVKILDICYGIGYNTKSALQIFLNCQKKIKNKKKKNSNSFSSIATIDTDNNFWKNKTFLKKYNATIHSDNMMSSNNKSDMDLAKIKNEDNIYTEAIDSNNIMEEKPAIFYVDAIDADKILIELSPFVGRRNKIKLFDYKSKRAEKNVLEILSNNEFVKKIIDKKPVSLEKKYKISKEAEIILFLNLLKKFDIKNDIEIERILKDESKKYFFSKYMIEFLKFYKNKGYKYSSGKNKSLSLHNIYYEYISTSYKKALEINNNNKIDINFHNIDARSFVATANSSYDFIFLDAFTPAKCPALWTSQFFSKLYELLSDNGMLLTYSNAAPIRKAMIKNNFYIGKIFNPTTEKFMGTVATKNKNLIEHNLTHEEINLLDTKAGICYNDVNLKLSNEEILKQRAEEVNNSNLMSSAKYFRRLKHEKKL